MLIGKVVLFDSALGVPCCQFGVSYTVYSFILMCRCMLLLHLSEPRPAI